MPLGGGVDGVCNIVLGNTPSTKIPEFWNSEYYWATISDMKDRYVMKPERTLSRLGTSQCEGRLLPEGAVLVSFKLSIGKVSISGTDIYTNEASAGLIPKDTRVISEYLYHLIPTLNLKNYMQPAAKGKTLNKRILENIPIPVPALPEQRKFVGKMNQLEADARRFREVAKDLDKKSREYEQSFLVSH